ncbi:hypothetical protein [Vreelandella nigrificans]|uniref:Uncharacterized protein n=1 Tax=Vreelandella nigrificans TaxID=2042704 RepID=A0A2A4HPC9_9GAMM|nr:hypothetical protein [Halomonas nigrificans]PCF96626.1 hypothetical protein CPA45_06320 [Halomonas nigrificans]
MMESNRQEPSAHQNAASAMLAVFPTTDSLKHFAKAGDNAPLLESLLAFAQRHGVLEEADVDALYRYIDEHGGGASRSLDAGRPQTLEELLDNRQAHLSLPLSIRAWTERINALLDKHQVALPRVSNSMLTRLKREPADNLHKQNVLRSLAFWIGHQRQTLGDQWHFEALLALCQASRRTENFTAGVRMGFSLSSRGDLIDNPVVNWLKRTLKRHLDQRDEGSPGGRWGKVHSHDITTLYIDIPKEHDSGAPLAYRQCLRQAVSLAHKVAISWALSEHSSHKRFLSIGLTTGEFSSLDGYLLPLLGAELPGDPVVRVSNFTRQCLQINDIRVLYQERPTEVTLFNGEVLAAWPLTALWSFIYFDFAPELQSDPVLNATGTRFEFDTWQTYTPNTAKDAISTFLRTPHNAMLGIEIAKTLYYRHRFAEACDILRIVLSIDPSSMVARTLRMMIYRNMAVECPTLSGATALFRMAAQDAWCIRQHNASLPEDYYCEVGVLALAEALTLAKFSRAAGNAMGEEERFLALLEEAADLFEKGMSVSPAGLRSSFLLASARLLKAFFRADPHLLIDDRRRVDGSQPLAAEQTINLLRLRGYDVEAALTPEGNQFVEHKLLDKITFHNDAIALRAYRPTLCYTAAVALWDFTPQRTAGLARQALALIEQARTMARELTQSGFHIYSFSRIYGEILTTERFLEHMDNAEQSIRRTAGNTLDAWPNHKPLPLKKQAELLLMANFPTLTATGQTEGKIKSN